MTLRSTLTLLALACMVPGCSSDNGTTGGGGDVLLPPGPDAPDRDQGTDERTVPDLPVPDSLPDMADPGGEDGVLALDLAPVDPGLPDPGLPDLGTDPGSDLGTDPDAVAYGRCNHDSECPEGLVCDLPYLDAAYGFCSRTCNHDSECPASTLPIPQGCHKEPGALSGWCTSLCGIHAGGSTTCEEWLQCVASQWCLPPSTTVPTKGPGESCRGGAECLSGECIEGENTRAHCALKCSSDGDCAGPNGQWKGTCVSAAGLDYNFCIWMCGMMASGASCPGDLQCVGMSVCQ
ncbi:MAG TPA: hypothetical protein PLQ97_13120 [Myxococcota bacterium]|nr:hypothetical protein [Myxococcota bacterium]HQK52131.1 hypothetical protein [Myxococcota bacterium]